MTVAHILCISCPLYFVHENVPNIVLKRGGQSSIITMKKTEAKQHADMAKKKSRKEPKEIQRLANKAPCSNVNMEEDWPTTTKGGVVTPTETPFVVFSTMYTTAFVLELVENWTDLRAATFFLTFLGIFLVTNCRLGVYLLFIATATIYELVWRFPDVPNHVNLAIYMNMLQLVAGAGFLSKTSHATNKQEAGHRMLSNGRRRLDFFRAIRPILGLAMFLTYFFAGFHKLNTDFFDHRVSCTNEFMKNIMQFYKGIVPTFEPSASMVMTVSIVTVAWELGGSMALFFQRTQPYMILYSIMMHMILAPCSFYDFSTMMFSCFTLFMPPTYWKVYEKDKDLVLPLFGPLFGWKTPRHVLYASSAILVGMATWQYRPETRQEGQFREIQFRAGQICCLCFLVMSWPMIRSFLLGKLPPWQSPFRWTIHSWHAWLLPFYTLFMIHGMGNYLGLRTAGTFSMFSNLRTEGARSNHLLLSSNPLKIWHFQDDIVYINEAMIYRGTIDNRQTILKHVGYPLVEFQKKRKSLCDGSIYTRLGVFV
jgi:hypothetical protein